MIKTIQQEHPETSSSLAILAERLGSEMVTLGDVSIVSVDNDAGLGQLRATKLHPGIQVLDIDLTAHSDFYLNFDNDHTDTLQFYYALKGDVFHSFENRQLSHFIEQFQTAVAYSNIGILSQVLVKKDTQVILNIISVDKKAFFDEFSSIVNQFSSNLRRLLNTLNEPSTKFHSGSYNLKIAEQLNLLLRPEHANEVSELLSQRGRYFLILAKHIEQFYEEIENDKNTSGLLRKELSLIADLSTFIRESPEVPHSLKSLCSRSGLSPAKLQQGFKFMYNRTVSDFVRSTRLEIAEKLIRTTDLSISEIVYSVGLTSRSYFCKIFKKRYKFSPKDYRKKRGA